MDKVGPVDSCPLPPAVDSYQNSWSSVRSYCYLLTQAADTYDLDIFLLAGLVWYESGGDPEAYSQSGAMGLMQVMPRDGVAAKFMCINGPCFASRPSMEELKDPDFNVNFGSRMLAGSIRRLGSLREALKSYGPMDVGYDYADTVLSLREKIFRAVNK